MCGEFYMSDSYVGTCKVKRDRSNSNIDFVNHANEHKYRKFVCFMNKLHCTIARMNREKEAWKINCMLVMS